MKKIFSFLAIATIVATTFTSCKDNGSDEPKNPKKAKLSVVVDKPTLKAGDTGKFTVKSDIAALEAIVVAVASEDTKIVTVAPASVTIAKDGKTIEGTYTAVADGKTKITITTTNENASIVAGSVEVTVGTPAPVGAEIAKMFTGFHEAADDKDMDYFYAYHEDPNDPKPEGERVNLAYFRIIDRGTNKDGVVEGVVVDVYSWYSKEQPMAMGVLKPLDASGEGIFLTAQTEGTPITFDAMVASPYGWYPTVCNPNYKDLATGKDIYLVIACGNGGKEGEGGTSANLRAWAKVNIGTAGGYSDVTFIEAYVCLNDGEFKVGQKE